MNWLDSTFHRALLEAALVGAMGGFFGVFVTVRRLSFFTMALTHATFPGIVIAALLGVNLYLGAGLFGVAITLIVVLFACGRGQDFTATTGVALSGGFALGVVLVSAQSGFSRDLAAYSVGDILAVSDSDLLITAGVGLTMLLVLAAIGKEALFLAFDPAGTAAAGLPAGLLNFALLAMIEITVVATVPALGAILTVALIVGPAATARLLSDRIGLLFPLAALIGTACALAGIQISAIWDVAAGASIALLVGLMFAVAFLASHVRDRGRRVRGGRLQT